jgi:hypothetical protein
MFDDKGGEFNQRCSMVLLKEPRHKKEKTDKKWVDRGVR